MLPCIGTSSNNFQAGSTGPIGASAVGDYFINTANKNLYVYSATGATGPLEWNSIMAFDSYTPGNTGHWASAYPTTITQAINRLASAVYGLLGNTGIPNI